MSDLPYDKIPEPPSAMNASSILVRLVDGIGFRYRWATEGMKEEDMGFQPCDGSMEVWKLLAHINGLLNVSEAFLTGSEIAQIQPVSLEERRKLTLDTVVRIREALIELDDDYLAERLYKVPWAQDELPIWYVINGPLSDTLTHIGQIASWRRINENPILGANVFFGTPPKKT